MPKGKVREGSVNHQRWKAQRMKGMQAGVWLASLGAKAGPRVPGAWPGRKRVPCCIGDICGRCMAICPLALYVVLLYGCVVVWLYLCMFVCVCVFVWLYVGLVVCLHVVCVAPDQIL